MGVFSENAIIGASAAGGYDIDQSLRLDGYPGTTNQHLERSPSSSGNRKTFTISFWHKPSLFAKAENDHYIKVRPDADNQLQVSKVASNDQLLIYTEASASGRSLQTSRVFRDPSQWYHFVIAVDTTQATASNRVKLYVNGVQETDFGTEEYPDQDAQLPYNQSGVNQDLLWSREDSGRSPSGYFAEWHSIDGTALDASSFGETNEDTNQWQAIEYTGSYGTNGFYLKFQDSSALGDDSSGNTNDFTTVSVAATDQVLDSPTNNWCTLNPLETSTYNLWTFTEGNLKGYGTPGDNFTSATFIIKSGKWYFEVDITDNGGKAGMYVTLNGLDDHYLSESFDERIIDGPANTGLYGVSIDMDAGSWSTTYNGSSFQSGSFTPQECKIGFTNGTGAFIKRFVVNFGQDSSFAGARTAQGNTDSNGKGDFFYTPAAGYLALCSDNLSDPSIADPTAHFNTVTYSGNSSTQAITGVGHQPDFTWFKAKNNAYDHSLVDSVRGVNKAMASNTTSAESGFGTNYTIDSFDSDGFTLHNATYNNASGTNYVAWNWKAGGTAVSNTDGSLTASVSANTTAGFSIISYTGDDTQNSTIGHGLSQAPELAIFKPRGSSSNEWTIWMGHITGTYNEYLYLNTTAALASSAYYFGTSGPVATASTLKLGESGRTNNSASPGMICYAFHSVDGYSKIGKYAGNGAQNGSFVYTGFRPAFIFIKRITNAGSNSYIVDNKRIGYNHFVYLTDAGSNKYLWPDSNAAEGNGNTTKGIGMDILSNGFKFRTSGGDYNASSNDYLFYAIAESPFKTANAR